MLLHSVDEVATLAGNNHSAWVDGVGSQASFHEPTGLAVVASGAVLVADTFNNRIRLISPSGIVTTFAGSGNQAWADGVGSQASFNHPFGVAVMASGAAVVADQGSSRIRLVSPLGIVTTLAGSGHAAWADGIGSQASFKNPSGLAVTVSGFVLVADTFNNRIRFVSPLGNVTTFAGSGNAAWADGIGSQASFNFLNGVAIMASGTLVVADTYNNRIRFVSPSGIVTTLAGSGNAAWVDGVGSQASFNYPSSVAVMASGAVVVADNGNNRIRLVSPSGIVTTLAGSGIDAWADGVGLQSSFNQLTCVAVMRSGALLVADSHNNRIRKMYAVPPFQSNCPAGFSWAGTHGCIPCSIGMLCPNGTFIIMLVFALYLPFLSMNCVFAAPLFVSFCFFFVSLCLSFFFSLSLSLTLSLSLFFSFFIPPSLLHFSVFCSSHFSLFVCVCVCVFV